MMQTDDKSKEPAQDNAAVDVNGKGSDKEAKKDKADVYDPVGMAGKKAGIVEEVKEEERADQKAGKTEKD